MKPIWNASEEQESSMLITKFMQIAGFKDYESLHEFSINHPDKFWPLVADFCGAVAQTWGNEVLSGGTMFDAKWFTGAKLNYSENLLQIRDDTDAIIFHGEDKASARLSHEELYDEVAKLAQYLRGIGVKKGDVIAGFLPNIPGAVIAMLATASIGAIWSSCSPDFGKQGVLDRFGQIEPKVLFGVDGYYYNGKTHSVIDKIAEFSADLPTLQTIIIFEYTATGDVKSIHNAVKYDIVIASQSACQINFEMVDFDHPLFILFSSGTTGAPKCIVHGHGGTLLAHLKEHQLHSDIKQKDRVFYYSTCSWMMWNWLVSSLGSGAAIMLYDGSPFYPSPNVLWDYAEREKFTHFGTSAKYLEALDKANFAPNAQHDLTALRMIASTGSPLSAEGYDYVYDKIGNVHLASISGGTDIISCFVLGAPNLPVYRGEIQVAGLGMAVEVWGEDGKPVKGARGELVCAKPFPSRPVKFWNDDNHKKYHEAYFERFENVWAQGDFAEITEHNGIIIYGRSDATLNPGGVRIGTAEIYRQVDKVPQVLESIVIGQEWDNDVRVVLFVKMRNGFELDDDIRGQIKSVIKANCTPRHVPSIILEVSDIPRTKSGKIVEIPVREIVHGRTVKNIEALSNPNALEEFKGRTELQK